MTEPKSDWQAVGPVASWGSEEIRLVELSGRMLSVGRVGGRYFALDNTCPHAGGSLAAGSLEGSRLVCPLHAWDFDVFSGECARFGQKVTSHRVRVEGGILEVRLERLESVFQG